MTRSGDNFGKRPSSQGILPSWMQDPSKFQRQLANATFSLLIIVLVIHLLRELETVFQPLFIAVFITYLLVPMHQWVVQRGVPKRLSFVVILGIFAGIFYGLGIVIYADVQALMHDWKRHQDQLVKVSNRVIESAVEKAPFLKQVGVRTIDVNKVPSPPVDPTKIPSDSKPTPQKPNKQWTEYFQELVGSFFTFLVSLFVVFVYLLFLLLERRTFRDRLDRAFGASNATRVVDVANSINRAVSQYIIVKTISSIATGIAAAVVLTAFNVPYPLTWGILTFLFNYVPYVGSVIASILPVLLCFAQPMKDLWEGFVLAGCLMAVHQLIGNVIEPRFIGSRLRVSPLLIIMSLAFWGSIWGIVGMILAIPILVICQIVLKNIQETEPIAILMSNE